MNWTENEYAEYQRKNGSKAVLEPVKRSKYNNNHIRVDGILFDSQKEADYYSDLKLRLRAGEIKGFCRQPEFVLLEGFADVRPETYKADFIVWKMDGTADVIDVKGMETEVFRIKRKQFMEKFPGLRINTITE